MKSEAIIKRRRAARRDRAPNPEMERMARQAPKQWRTETDLSKAGFEPISGGVHEAVRAARLRKLTLHLSSLRKEAGLTQAQVAKRMNTTASAVSRLESTNPENLTIDTLNRYAAAVGAELRITMDRS